MINVNLCSDCPAEEQIASLRRMLLAGDLAQPYEDILSTKVIQISPSFRFVCCMSISSHSHSGSRRYQTLPPQIGAAPGGLV